MSDGTKLIVNKNGSFTLKREPIHNGIIGQIAFRHGFGYGNSYWNFFKIKGNCVVCITVAFDDSYVELKAFKGVFEEAHKTNPYIFAGVKKTGIATLSFKTSSPSKLDKYLNDNLDKLFTFLEETES